MDKLKEKICLECGKIFEKKIGCSQSNWSAAKHCSRSCSYSAMRRNNKGVCSNTGRTHIKKGQKLSPGTQFKEGHTPHLKGKSNPRFAGPNNPNWKGGVYPERLKIRHSVEMKRWRLQVFDHDNYTCVLCLRQRKAGDRVILHADHYPETFVSLIAKFQLETFEQAKKCAEFWNPSHGRTLCRECHLKTDTHGVNSK